MLTAIEQSGCRNCGDAHHVCARAELSASPISPAAKDSGDHTHFPAWPLPMERGPDSDRLQQTLHATYF
jgi:hypothetical protein